MCVCNCGTRTLRVNHGRVEHPSGAAPLGTPHARATFKEMRLTLAARGDSIAVAP